MKIEKINDSKVKITLTADELKQRKIDIKDIESDVDLARNLFIDLIEESNLDEDFSLDNCQLYIEASSDNNNLFIVTITKIDQIPELSKYSLMKKAKNKKGSTRSKVTMNALGSTKNINYKVDSTMFLFDSIDTILDMCNIIKSGKLYCGKNSLYKYIDNYYIIFDKNSIKNIKFLKTFCVLSEYCIKYYSDKIFDISIKENSKLILKDNALQKLKKI